MLAAIRAGVLLGKSLKREAIPGGEVPITL
jgi:hypothetical protein